MIVEKKISGSVVERKSDRGVYIRNEQTGFDYTVAVDLENNERIRRGLIPYSYVETEKSVEIPEEYNRGKSER